jgi:diaminopimelate epimerase
MTLDADLVAAGEMAAHLTLDEHGERVTAVRVNMGRPLFARRHVPCLLREDGGSEDDPILMAEYRHTDGRTFRFSSVLVGVPHTILIVERADDEELIRSVGPVIEKDRALFPQGTNVGFVQVLADNHINYRYVSPCCSLSRAWLT